MESLAGAWALAGLSIAALLGCAAYNRLTGYHRTREEESPLDDALMWLAAAKSGAPQPAARLQDIAMAEASTQQLIRLYSAYQSKDFKPAGAVSAAEAEADYVLTEEGRR